MSFSSNKADRLNKNSYTTIGNQVIKSVTVKTPSDQRLELGLDRSFELGQSVTLNTLAGIGSTDSSNSGLFGNLSRGNCDYEFEFNYNGGSLNQVDQCGSVTSLSRVYPNDATVQQDFGVSPSSDLRNKSVYGRVGFGVSKDHGKWSFTSQYYFQKYFRDKLDDRINLSSNESYEQNHVFATAAQRKITKAIMAGVRAEYHRHRYLDEIPVLYTRLTSERFKEEAFFFSLSLTYSLAK